MPASRARRPRGGGSRRSHSLNAAGVPCGVLIAPVLPGISDSPEQLADVVEACVQAGAVSVSPILLHLRPGVREIFMPWLEGYRPDLVARYRELYPSSYATPGARARLSHQIDDIVDRIGGTAVPPSRTREAA